MMNSEQGQQSHISKNSRAICVACKRPHSTCICHWVRPQSTAAEVIIVQHPLEVNQAKGSGRLLHLSLSGSVLIIGEVLTDATLALITDPTRQPMLLYPPTDPTGVSISIERQAESSDTPTPDPSALRLIVLDATWRKSRKMLHKNPLLQSLPRLALRDPPPSRYAIRKAHHPHQRSTLEATCEALLQLGEAPAPLQALLSAFDGFVAQQAAFTPPR